MGYDGGEDTQYDVWPGVRHVGRMISVQGVPSPARANTPPKVTIDQMRRDIPISAGKPVEIAAGSTARAVLADRAREKIGRSSGRDMSVLSDSESLDLIEHILFPTMVPWGGQSLPI